MRKFMFFFLAASLLTSVGVLADTPDTDPIATQLNKQQQREYQKQLNQAVGDQERAEVTERYRESARQQSASDNAQGADCGNRGNDKARQSGSPCRNGKSAVEGKGKGAGVPAGNKNKPQKSGK